MTDFLATNPLTLSAAESPRFPFLNSRQTPTPRTQLNPNYGLPFSSKPSKTSCDNKTLSWALSSRSNEGPSRGYGFYNELQFEDVKEKTFGLERNPVAEDSPTESGPVPFDDKGEGDLVRVQGDADGDGDDLKKGDGVDESDNEKFGGKRVRRGKQVIRRSNLLAKQVISIRSALSMGFVSQLWVDTTSVSLENSCSISVLCSLFVLLACVSRIQVSSRSLLIVFVGFVGEMSYLRN